MAVRDRQEKRNRQIERQNQSLANDIADGAHWAREERYANQASKSANESINAEITANKSDSYLAQEMFMGRSHGYEHQANVQSRTGGLNLKNIGSGVEYNQIDGLMDEMGFSGEQKTAFKSMYDSHNNVRDVAKEVSNETQYNKVRAELNSNYNNFNNMSNGERVAAQERVVGLNRERTSLEEKIKSSSKGASVESATNAATNRLKYSGDQLSSARNKFFDAMGNDAAKLETFSGGLKNLKPLEANKPLQKVEQELVEKGGKFGRVGKVAVGALAMLGVVNMLGGDRGQMENSTLYNPGGPI